MTGTHSLLVSLSRVEIHVEVVDDRLRLTGNLAALTDDLKETLRNHKPAILELLSVSTYPNPDGMVKCCYCTHLDGYRCTRGYHPGGTALLRECSDFSFERKDQQHEKTKSGSLALRGMRTTLDRASRVHTR